MSCEAEKPGEVMVIPFNLSILTQLLFIWNYNSGKSEASLECCFSWEGGASDSEGKRGVQCFCLIIMKTLCYKAEKHLKKMLLHLRVSVFIQLTFVWRLGTNVIFPMQYFKKMLALNSVSTHILWAVSW